MKLFKYLSSGLIVAVCFVAVSPAQDVNPSNSMADFCTNLPRPEYSDLQRLSLPEAVAQGWFEAYEVEPGIIAIYEPYQWQEVISYLIIGETEALLFDTGNGLADIAMVVRALTDKPVSVLNSHTHYDHVGGNYAFDKIYGLNTDFTRARQQGVSNQAISIEASPEALCHGLPQGVTQATHVGRPFTVTDMVGDGSLIDLGGRVLEVIQLPGHTPDAIALIDREAGLLWTGDTYYSGPIWLMAPETDLERYSTSLDRLISEAPNLKALLPAHNTPWVDPAVLVRVRSGFDVMLSGGASKLQAGEGLVEYRLPGENTFSFIMRDEALPYAK